MSEGAVEGPAAAGSGAAGAEGDGPTKVSDGSPAVFQPDQGQVVTTLGPG